MTALRPALAGLALLAVTVLLVAQGRTGSWHAALLLQLEQLTNWSSGVLGGKASLVTQCARGVDSACDALVSDPGAVAALQHIDAKNPHGFTAKHPHKAATLQRKFQVDGNMYRPAPAQQLAHRVPEPISYYKENREVAARQEPAVAQAVHRVPEPLSYYKKTREARKAREDSFDRAFGRMHAVGRVAEPISYYGKGFTGVEKDYKTAKSTKEEWGLPAWKDGALGGGNSQWLKACAEGNYFACGKIEKANDDVHDVLKPKHPIHRAANKGAAMPSPVFVAPRKKSVWSELMDAVGLGDSYYKNSQVLHSVPSMEPDAGLDARGTRKVYNDGTVGFLSDQ
jgi:hypothetical protein